MKRRIQKAGSAVMGQPIDSAAYSGLVDLGGLPLFPPFLGTADVHQGVFQNCYVEACTLGMLAKFPRLLGFMLRRQGSGIVEQSFYSPTYGMVQGRMALISNGEWKVSVDGYMPIGANRYGASSYVNYLEKLWVAWCGVQSGVYSWAMAERGYPGSVLNAWGFDLTYLGRGFPVASIDAVASKPSEIAIMTTNADVMGGHCLCVHAIDRQIGMATILNPWGSDGIFADNQNDGTIQIPLSQLDAITNNVVMTNGIIWTVPNGPSPTDPKRVQVPPKPSPLQP